MDAINWSDVLVGLVVLVVGSLAGLIGKAIWGFVTSWTDGVSQSLQEIKCSVIGIGNKLNDHENKLTELSTWQENHVKQDDERHGFTDRRIEHLEEIAAKG